MLGYTPLYNITFEHWVVHAQAHHLIQHYVWPPDSPCYGIPLTEHYLWQSGSPAMAYRLIQHYMWSSGSIQCLKWPIAPWYCYHSNLHQCAYGSSGNRHFSLRINGFHDNNSQSQAPSARGPWQLWLQGVIGFNVCIMWNIHNYILCHTVHFGQTTNLVFILEDKRQWSNMLGPIVQPGAHHRYLMLVNARDSDLNHQNVINW